jgi:hypothetical protein
MISSGEEVVLLFRRLFYERLPVLVFFASADNSLEVKISGFVNALAPDMILFSDGEPVPTSSPSNFLTLDPHSIIESRYGEIKDAEGVSVEQKSELESKYASASLAFKLSSGARLTVFELSLK